MKAKNIIILLFTLAFLLGCSDNIFGSSGGGASECGSDIGCLRIDAEEAFRNGKYEKSFKLYESIVKADSNASVGYFGMAKAGLWMHHLTIFSLIGIGKDNMHTDEPMKVLLQAKTELKNDYYQGSKKAYRALLILNERDSLTELYNNKELNCKGNKCSVTIDGKETTKTFPLTDGEFKRVSLNSGFYVVQLLYTTISTAIDIMKNGCIYDAKPKDVAEAKKIGCDVIPPKGNKSSLLEYKCDDSGNCSLQLNVENLYDEFLDDKTRQEYNDILDDFENRIKEITDIINPSGDPDDEMQKQLEDVKGYTTFYKLHTGVDTDGDGCIDEELIYDEQVYDTDGDGLYGENSRIIVIPKTAFSGCGDDHTSSSCRYEPVPPARYGIDHNANGNSNDYFIMYKTKGEIDSIRVAWSLAENGYHVNTDREIRMKVQTESDGCWSLQDRKDMIGGCWMNYDKAKFKAYRTNAKQRTEGGMNPACYNDYEEP